jgi:hypothetical protein
MIIVSAQYDKPDNSSVQVVYDTGMQGAMPASHRRVAEYVAGGGTIDPYQAPPIRPEDVQSERARRLALGFSYDFEDARGVHQIGTTPADMVGWRDVIDLANALIDLGDTTTTIDIVTDTGPTQVTAPEWQAVMLRAAEVRQVLWASSFTLQAMDPIPEDYDADGYWS